MVIVSLIKNVGKPTFNFTDFLHFILPFTYEMSSYEELVQKQELETDTKIEIFIEMLNKGNSKILTKDNKETLKGYPSINLSSFWKRYQLKIKKILFDKEKENPAYEKARRTILDKERVGSYEELVEKKRLEAERKELGVEKQIEIFIEMLNDGNKDILKNINTETLKGYPSINLSYFWSDYNPKIKEILFKKEKENPQYEVARQTILDKYGVHSYEELEFAYKSNLHLRIACFIKMLKNGNINIFKYENKETFEGYPSVSVGSLWHREKNREVIIKTLFEKLKDVSSYDSARKLVLDNLGVKTIEEYYEKSDSFDKELKDNSKKKKTLEKIIKMVDDVEIELDIEQRKRA